MMKHRIFKLICNNWAQYCETENGNFAHEIFHALVKDSKKHERWAYSDQYGVLWELVRAEGKKWIASHKKIGHVDAEGKIISHDAPLDVLTID